MEKAFKQSEYKMQKAQFLCGPMKLRVEHSNANGQRSNNHEARYGPDTAWQRTSLTLSLIFDSQSSGITCLCL